MANLKDVIYLSAEDYNTLYTNGTVTINGVTLTYDANNVYIVPDNTQQQIDDILALIPSDATSSNKLATADDIPTIPSNNVTGSGTSGSLTKFNGTNTIIDGPVLSSTISTQTRSTKFLREDGAWSVPSYTEKISVYYALFSQKTKSEVDNQLKSEINTENFVVFACLHNMTDDTTQGYYCIFRNTNFSSTTQFIKLA